MKADKLFYVFELTKKRLLSFKPQPGNATLAMEESRKALNCSG
jgi:hypothetical protein